MLIPSYLYFISAFLRLLDKSTLGFVHSRLYAASVSCPRSSKSKGIELLASLRYKYYLTRFMASRILNSGMHIEKRT